MSRPADRFAAIEEPAAVTGLPVVRAEREIDPQLLRSAELGFLNGHVPVTGILSAIAVLAAVLEDRDAVVMSNEWSASIPTLQYQGRPVNHQYSKSADFEAAFRGVLAGSPDYFSWLRDRTELWVGREFAGLEAYHGSFRSCNKAFYTDPARRLDHWCGQCDKCCFIDLILAPFMPAEALRRIFIQTGEPLDDPELAPKFRALLGAGAKPFECVGEVNECRAAVLLAARRDDRAGSRLLQELAAEVASWPDAPTAADAAAMLRPDRARTSSRPGTDDRSPPETLLVRPARRPGRRLGPGPRGPRQPAQAAGPRGGARPGRRPPGRPGRARHRRGRAGRPGAVRRGGQDAGPEPVPARGGPLDRARYPGGGRPGSVACRTGPAQGPVRDRHQGQEHHRVGHRAPAHRAGLPVPGRGQHRRRALRPRREKPTSTTGSSRCPATRPPTCRARRR